MHTCLKASIADCVPSASRVYDVPTPAFPTAALRRGQATEMSRIDKGQVDRIRAVAQHIPRHNADHLHPAKLVATVYGKAPAVSPKEPSWTV